MTDSGKVLTEVLSELLPLGRIVESHVYNLIVDASSGDLAASLSNSLVTVFFMPSAVS